MLLTLFQHSKFCGTRTDPATETKSIGLPADAQLAVFFARRLESLSWQVILCHLPGLTLKRLLPWQVAFHPSAGTGKKHYQPRHGRPLTKPAAVNNNTQYYRDIRLRSLQVIIFTMTRDFFAVYQICVPTLIWYFPNFISGDNSVYLDNFRRQPNKLADAHIKNWLRAVLC